ncbi:RagB/SusD family nutrient uptake outer membrane protein [Moheibacter lacus]|uniref:RagB/SusD family nutrient uptake outer membrane protein n=1 Tax=Moheibacter lacus TaxID=2745851 RepID=A0A838ZPV1_9FLAO|nr:RagB/SusD family nutrient uptake outer membrane protein [Moheibacter lacus]MBA5629597.1 RagB/SusD family nutrient uptake outer membrane protein [Moheibacter lacus]
MKNITKYLLLIGIFVLSGCSDDFLEVDPEEDVLESDSGEVYTPEMYVNGVYGYLTDWTYAFSWLGVTEIISDNADKGSSPSDTGGDKHLLDALEHTSTTGSIEACWTTFYKTIGRANIAIQYTEEYGLTDETYKNRLIGEAKFLRALHYFWLVRMFGDVPIQVVDDPASWETRVAKAEVYAYIEQDLLDAISTLPNKSDYPSMDLGRATKGAAQGLLAKVYLYQEKWQDAYDMAGTVMSSGQYGLEADYGTIWRASTENGTESLFEVQARGESINHGVNQYSQTQGARGSGGWGWGFNVPSENLLNAFNNASDTIRRDGTIIFRGETLWDGREVPETVENPMYNEKAYSSANLGDSDTDKNIRILRYAEILLIRAEAAIHAGGDVATPLNMVRNRAGLTSIANPTVEQIWLERRLELAFEHDRWFDLVRTGQAESAMAADGKTFVVGKHELFPIPNSQLIQTPAMTQNPGW